MFPIPLGEAASWDLEMIERNARIAAIESAAGLHWTFTDGSIGVIHVLEELWKVLERSFLGLCCC